jgi:hypothetical protein
MGVFRAALVILVLTTGACTSNALPTSPSTGSLSLTGNWSGDVLVDVARARMSWTLTQNITAVDGPVMVSLMNGTVLMNGVLAGAVNGTSIDYRIAIAPGAIPSQPTCSGELGGTATAGVAGPSTLSGNFSLLSSGCSPPVSTLSFMLTRSAH